MQQLNPTIAGHKHGQIIRVDKIRDDTLPRYRQFSVNRLRVATCNNYAGEKVTRKKRLTILPKGLTNTGVIRDRDKRPRFKSNAIFTDCRRNISVTRRIVILLFKSNEHVEQSRFSRYGVRIRVHIIDIT